MRKIKSVLVMVLILSLLLLGTILGIVVTGGNRQDTIEDVVPEEEEIVIPDTFVGTINNQVGVPSGIVDLITNYNDDYYMSLFTLEQVSTANYFEDEIDGAVSDAAIQLILDSRKLYDFDFTLTKAHYDLNFTECYSNGNTYYVYFLMNDSMNFAFLGDIASSDYDVENYMEVEYVNDEYKIVDYDKTQGYYMMFYENDYDSLSDVQDVYDYYYNQLKNTIENEEFLKTKAQENEYVSELSYDVAYNRDAAITYANKYYHLRNEDWYDFSEEGGNCQNYASQCLNAGGIIMDYYGEDEWKCFMVDGDYDPGLDYSNSPYGRTASWVQVAYFHDYCENNSGTGLVSDPDININYAEPGDLVQVGISSLTHTTVVSKVVDGHILLNSNSIDMENWPLEAYTYPTRKLIKILGYNN